MQRTDSSTLSLGYLTSKEFWPITPIIPTNIGLNFGALRGGRKTAKQPKNHQSYFETFSLPQKKKTLANNFMQASYCILYIKVLKQESKIRFSNYHLSHFFTTHDPQPDRFSKKKPKQKILNLSWNAAKIFYFLYIDFPQWVLVQPLFNANHWETFLPFICQFSTHQIALVL